MAPFSSYEKVELIGEGYYGKVYLAINPRGRKMAFKEISLANKSSSAIRKAVSEAKMIQSFSSPFLVKSYGHFCRNGFLTIAMEFAEYGSLHDHVLRYRALYNENRILDAFAQLVVGLSHLHDLHIIHRDLSTDNILVKSNWHMKIADFGISKSYDAAASNNAYVRGNLMFLAPELIFYKMSTYKTDIWSLGVVLFYMASSRFPYYGDSMREVYQNIHRTHRIDVGYQYGMNDVEELLNQTLNLWPEERPTCESLMVDDILHEHVDLVCEEFGAFN